MKMDRSCNAQRFFWRALVLFLSLPAHQALSSKSIQALNNRASAFLVFGDSTVDPGNNNHLNTVFKSNFPPYGRDFTNRVPTGRFSNGRLVSDFMASYVGVKDDVPAYFAPNLNFEDLKTGVSFASAGSGYDPLTPKISNVLSLPKQLEYFKEYKKRLMSRMGKQSTADHINNAVFFLSAGTNDFVVNYFTLPIRRRSFTIAAYQQFVLQHLKDLIKLFNFLNSGFVGGRSEKDISVGIGSNGLLANHDHPQLEQRPPAERLHGPILIGGKRLQRTPPDGVGLHAKQLGKSRFQNLLCRFI
ncbi:hypothetical protein ACJRO7_017271 [Eucalyptus globulus]|uniref:GDSL esterase/lipase n=1 Tax=Eucalyptus globulus TaxID=34317 RepID=A0ABD3KW47_EUCGL